MQLFDRKTQRVDGEQVNLPEPAAEAEHNQTIKRVESSQEETTVDQAGSGSTTADLIAALIDRLQDDARAAAKGPEQPILHAIAVITQTVTGLRQDMAAYVTQRDQTDQEILGQLADLRAEHRQMRAVLDQLSTVNDQSHTALAREPAVRALIAVDEQLAKVFAAVTGKHRAVIAGQRSNLRQTLDQLGVRAIEPPHGATFDPSRHRSSSTTAQTADADLSERVASLMRAGWELSDGRLLAPAEVVLYVFTPTAVEPLSAFQQGEAAQDPPTAASEPAIPLYAATGPDDSPSAEQAPSQSPPAAVILQSGQSATSAAEQRDGNLGFKL